MKQIGLSRVNEVAKEKDLICISDEYINGDSKLKFKCSKNHIFLMTYYSLTTTKGCPICRGRLKLFEDVISYITNEGYKCLSNNWINSGIKLDIECPDGHLFKMSWSEFYRGIRCPVCAIDKKRKLISDIKKFAKERGYECISSKRYDDPKKKLTFKCRNEHLFEMSWGGFKNSKHPCRECWKEIKSCQMYGEGNPNWRGGCSFEPYCIEWNHKTYKELIKNRDGNKCLNPYCDSPDPNDLTIHHVDYNKKNCSEHNVITVCRSCNSKANWDRKWHTSWYKAILYRRYYLETKEKRTQHDRNS